MSQELSNSKLHPNYFIAIYYNGDVVNLSSSSNEIPTNSSVRFIVHCEYYRSTSKGYGVFYTNRLFDFLNERISDNTFNWEGIKCHIHEKESWGDIRDIWVRLTVDIWDKFESKETCHFENHHHDGFGFRELFIYISDLTIVHSHTAVRFIRGILAEKDSEITSLKNKIAELENQSLHK